MRTELDGSWVLAAPDASPPTRGRDWYEFQDLLQAQQAGRIDLINRMRLRPHVHKGTQSHVVRYANGTTELNLF
jgi:hypothetical protein